MGEELVIRDLHVEIDGKEILKGVNLTVKPRRSGCPYGSERLGKKQFSVYDSRPS